MLKRRLIPVLFLRNGWLVRSESFCEYKNLGNPVAQVDRYNAWDVDELIYIDISSSDSEDHLTRGKLSTDQQGFSCSIFEVIDAVAERCFMPLTVGGGIRTLDDIQMRLSRGADKVTINSEALRRPDFIGEAAAQFGSQAIVVSMDFVRDNGGLQIYSRQVDCAGLSAGDWIREIENQGAGEIFLNSVDRDGRATGYDLDLIRLVMDKTSIPVIACGGAGSYDDFVELFEQTGVSAAAAGNIFHFREMSYILAKRRLIEATVNVR
ncbi:MAG: imidazole glycerol phosphate synthase subunit HisF [Bdellovibrionales bacterium]|nr:imidazole glycerol phosphate synthase subunit HisF [Bdellovibrionales bacterium]